MASRGKGRIHEKAWKDRQDFPGESVEIRIHPDGLFTAEFREQYFANKVLDNLKNDIKKYARETLVVEWFPVIAFEGFPGLKAFTNLEGSSKVHISFRRFHIGKMTPHDPKWIRPDWNADQLKDLEGIMWANKSFKAPCRYYKQFYFSDWRSGRTQRYTLEEGIDELPLHAWGNGNGVLHTLMRYDERVWNTLVELNGAINAIAEIVLNLIIVEEGSHSNNTLDRKLGMLFSPDYKLQLGTGEVKNEVPEVADED